MGVSVKVSGDSRRKERKVSDNPRTLCLAFSRPTAEEDTLMPEGGKPLVSLRVGNTRGTLCNTLQPHHHLPTRTLHLRISPDNYNVHQSSLLSSSLSLHRCRQRHRHRIRHHGLSHIQCCCRFIVIIFIVIVVIVIIIVVIFITVVTHDWPLNSSYFKSIVCG